MMKMNIFSLSKIHSDVTGKWSFEWKAFAFLAPLHILVSVLMQSDFSNPNSIIVTTIANTAAMAITGIACTTLLFTVFRNRKRRSVSIFWVLFAGLLIGGTKSFFTGYFEFRLGIAPDYWSHAFSRTLSTAILGLWLAPMVAIVYATRERFEIEREALIAEKVRLALSAGQVLEGKAANNAVLASNEVLSAVMQSIRDQIKVGALLSVDEYKKTAELFRKIIQFDLRPLSHKIWEQENSRHPTFSFRDLLRVTVMRMEFHIPSILALYSVSLIFNLLAIEPAALAFLDASIAVAILAVVLFLFQKFRPRNPKWAWPLFIGLCLFLPVSMEIARELIFGIGFDVKLLGRNLTNFLWLSELIIGMGIVRVAQIKHVEIQRELADLIGEESANQQILLNRTRLVNRELAQHIHGELQNQVLASALRIEKAEDLNDSKVISRELDRVEELLLATTQGVFLAPPVSIEAGLAEIYEQWAALTDLKIELGDSIYGLTLHPEVVRDTARLVNEAISNSIRHGFATKIRVEIDIVEPSRLNIVVTDNGTGPRNGNPGLGTALFDSVAGNDWSINSAVGGGSILRLTILLG